MFARPIGRAVFGGQPVNYVFTNAEAAAVVAAMSVAPTNARKATIDVLVGALKAGGVWSKLDLLYVLAAHDSQAARLNWISPGTATLSLVSAPTFVMDRGFTGDGSASYLAAGVNFSALTLYTQNDASMHAWSTSSGQAASATAGIIGGAGIANERLVPRDNTDVSQLRINAVVALTPASTDGSGQTGINRASSATLAAPVKNGVLGSTVASASQARPAADINLLRSNASLSNLNIALAAFGGSLTSGEWTASYDAELAYMQAVGAA